jgi:hypothetical protein
MVKSWTRGRGVDGRNEVLVIVQESRKAVLEHAVQ